MTQVDGAQAGERVTLDTSDVDRQIGRELGGGQLKEPVSATDIRRWVQGMQYPNPLHYDDEHAARSPIGRLVAPQSFLVCCDVGHGATPAIVGNIPGTHMIFGGDEWWFSGVRVYPGDHLRQRRWFVDYKIADTKFAGPTMFSRGDTVHTNERGELVAKQRSTAVRYLAEEARRRGFFHQTRARARHGHPSGWPRSTSNGRRGSAPGPASAVARFDDVSVGDADGDPPDRAAHDRHVHDRVAGVHLRGVGLEPARGSRPHRGGGLAAGDVAQPRGRPGGPEPGRRPLQGPVARSHRRGARRAHRPATRLRLRRVDGRVGARLRGPLGGRPRLRAPLEHPVPLPAVRGRRDVRRRSRRGQALRRPPSAPAWWRSTS